MRSIMKYVFWRTNKNFVIFQVQFIYQRQIQASDAVAKASPNILYICKYLGIIYIAFIIFWSIFTTLSNSYQ